MSGERRRWPLVLGGTAAALVLVAGGVGAYVRAQLRGSLAELDGERPLPGLGAPVRIERDALGVPVVRGGSRLDVGRATGFLHAQERFFQMDLLRRSAAGELAGLVGRVAVGLDREARPLRLRLVARRAVKELRKDERDLLAAYTAGVNAGLAALGARPFEYLALRAAPAKWRDEDSLLCALAMYRDLQGSQPAHESVLGLLRETLPRPVADFLAPVGTEWDAPIEGEPIPMPAVPGPDVLDLRKAKPEEPVARVLPEEPPVALALLGVPTRSADEGDLDFGSNNWAVAGSHTAHGGALLANDMHLGISVPNTWYRLSLVFPGVEGERRVTGVTLPGTPFVVAGSNGHVAWAFTNSEGDWADLVLLEPVPGSPDAYRTPDGPRQIERETETIEVSGERAETLAVESTVWGPVVDTDHAGRRRALAWVALREGGLNAGLDRMEAVGSLAEAQALAPEVGIPHQNFVVADEAGRIGWTIIGRIPRRVGHDGRTPTSWADGKNGWDGWLRPEEYPRVVDPPSGRIWTANARVVGGDKLARVGVGGYDLGARQGQIRDDLLAVPKASEDDMLRVQLDDRAAFLARWQKLLLETLTPDAVASDPRRAEARRLVEGWGGHASTGSAGYRIVRAFRLRVRDLVLDPLLAPARAKDPKRLRPGTAPNRCWEGPVWALVTARPAHLLDPRRASWDALLLEAADAVLDELTKDGRRLAERTWGERNTTSIRHPLARAVPPLGLLLDMPREALPGDSDMPRVQGPAFGASERLAVSPGHEDRGYFHMPCGQSGHPLSPHYADGHRAWAKGEKTPFLPGPPVHVLTLVPAP
ncbi:MAG TPA: penicillin acylase family protein [Vicinamibacteria bacterium]|nr:penicillin acylase family protein [Vicinamibacteria bacterium]